MRVAAYARVSTTRQAQAQGIEQQLDRLRAAAAERGWDLEDQHVYRDDGYSGARMGRPGLDRLRDHAALAELDMVLVTAPDRLARNYVHQVLLIDELAARGCQVEFLDRPMSADPHDHDMPAGDRRGDQLGQRDGPGTPAQVVADGAGVAVFAQEEEGMPVIVPVGGTVGLDLDHRPVVVLGALGRRAGAHPLPHAGLDQVLGGFHGEAAAGRHGDHVVGADGHDVAGAEFADALAQVKAP